MSGVDVVGVERFGVTEVAELLVWITQIAGRHQYSLAIQSSVQLHRNRFLLLVLYSCLAGRYAEQSAQGANDRKGACETTHRIYFFACLRACCGKWGITSARKLRPSLGGRAAPIDARLRALSERKRRLHPALD